MVVNNFLHLYLRRSPEPTELDAILRTYGFRFVRKDSKADPNEPEGYHWSWKRPPLSKGGFRLMFYHRLFSDDSFYGKYNAFAILTADKTSSDQDLWVIDIYSQLLLDRFGGAIYNPEGPTTNSHICGIEREVVERGTHVW